MESTQNRNRTEDLIRNVYNGTQWRRWARITLVVVIVLVAGRFMDTHAIVDREQWNQLRYLRSAQLAQEAPRGKAPSVSMAPDDIPLAAITSPSRPSASADSEASAE